MAVIEIFIGLIGALGVGFCLGHGVGYWHGMERMDEIWKESEDSPEEARRYPVIDRRDKI